MIGTIIAGLQFSRSLYRGFGPITLSGVEIKVVNVSNVSLNAYVRCEQESGRTLKYRCKYPQAIGSRVSNRVREVTNSEIYPAAK